jgi:hypothetical protein
MKINTRKVLKVATSLCLAALFGTLGLNYATYSPEGLSNGTSLASFAEEASYRTANFYEERGYNGRVFNFVPQQDYEAVNPGKIGIDNDSVSSLQIGPGLKAILCNHEYCGDF